MQLYIGAARRSKVVDLRFPGFLLRDPFEGRAFYHRQAS